MEYIVDVARRDEVLDAILDRYRHGGYPYNLKRSMLSVLKMPDRLRRGGEAEARFWLFACMLMRGGINSDTALDALSRMYDREMGVSGRQPFHPKRAQYLSIEEMSGLLQEAGTGLYRIARDWIAVAQLLVQRYDGQVLQMMSQIGDYDDAVRLLHNEKNRGLPGFQFKMVSMLIFFLTEAELIEYFPYPPPVDFHLQRVPIETLMIVRKDGNSRLAYTARQHIEFQSCLRAMYMDYIISRDIRSNEVSDAVWLLSRMMCRWNPGNTAYVPKERDGRKTIVTIHQADFTALSDMKRYERSCARCPVESMCERNVSSGPYYVQGIIGATGPRARPLMRQLNLLPD